MEKIFFSHRVIINIDQTLRLYDFFQKEYILIKNLVAAQHISHSVQIVNY